MATGRTLVSGFLRIRGFLSTRGDSGRSLVIFTGAVLLTGWFGEVIFFYSAFGFTVCKFCMLFSPGVRPDGLKEVRRLLWGLSICDYFLWSVIMGNYIIEA